MADPFLDSMAQLRAVFAKRAAAVEEVAREKRFRQASDAEMVREGSRARALCLACL